MVPRLRHRRMRDMRHRARDQWAQFRDVESAQVTLARQCADSTMRR